MSFVINQTETVMQKALLRFAKEFAIEPSQVQIVIFCKDDSMIPCYRLYVDYKPVSLSIPDIENSEVTFLQILGVEMDWINREEMVAPFLSDALKRFSAELKCSATDVAVMVLTKDNEKAKPLLLLKKGVEDVRQLQLETDVFMMPEDA